MIKFLQHHKRTRRPLWIAICALIILIPSILIYSIYARKANAAWYDAAWLYRKQLIFNNSAQASNLSNFPVMVKLTSSNFDFTQAKTNGEDIRFTDSNGTTLLSYELEAYDSTAKTGVAWVNVPQIDASSTTDSIYLYWGNSGASDAQSADNTWNSNYKGVYHLSDNAATTTVTDSSGLTNSLTSSENTSNGFSQSSGEIGKSFLTAGTPTYITDQTGTPIRELYPDLVLDSSGFPVIAYLDSTNQDLRLMHCNDKECKGNNETVALVDSTATTGYYPSIQLDGSGFPMIAYYDVSGLDLEYVHCTDANCTGTKNQITLDSTGNVGLYPRMVLDGSGFPVIVYYYASSADLKIIHCGNTDCSSGNVTNTVDGTVDAVGDGLHGSDIVLDGSGFPVISYYDTTNTELKVAHCNDVNCSGANESLTSPLSTLALSHGSVTAIELDGSGFPMIAYFNVTGQETDFIHCDDVNCAGDESASKKVIATNFVQFPNMEKNSSGNPVIIATVAIAYPYIFACADTNCSSFTTTILHANNQWNTTDINFKMDTSNNIYAVGYSRGKTNQYDAILYTTQHKLERAYDSDFDFGTSSFSISAWFKSNGMVQINNLITRYDTDQGFKIRLNHAGQPCFEIDDDATWGPDDSVCASDPLISTNVDSGNVTSVFWQDMVLDASGYPVITYGDANSLDLEIIHCNDVNCSGGNENYASLATAGDVGREHSLVLDASGFPVVAVYDSTTTDLLLIHCGNANCTSGNTTKTVDSGGSVGSYPSLKLDASGFPVIAYTDLTNTSVKVAHCNDANCDSTVNGVESVLTVDNTEDDRTQIGGQALQLDASGYPMIAYYNQTGLDLKYLHCVDVNCSGAPTIVTLEVTSNVGGFAAMELDSSGFPVIAHYDATNFDLRIMHCGNVNCNSGNVANIIATATAGDLGNYELKLKLNNSGYPVLLSTQLASMSNILVVCNDVNCSGDDETVSILRDGNFNYYYHALAIDSSGYPVISLASALTDLQVVHLTNATTYTEVGSYDDNAWHHLVAVKNGTSSITLYIDGVAVATDASLTATGTLTSNSASLNFAEEITNSFAQNNWTGYMDEVQIDTTARSADWIKAQYLSESNNFINVGLTQNGPTAVTLSTFTNNTGALKNNLVAYYKFDEGYGSTANNSGSAGSAVNGILTNGPTWNNNGKNGKSVVTDGEYATSDDYISIPDHATLDVQTGPFTVSAWINRQGSTSVGGSAVQPIVGKGRSAATYTYLLSLTSTGLINFGLYDGTNNPNLNSITAITSAGWHHVVGTYDGTNLLVYVDGKLENSVSKGAYSGTATTGTTEVGVWPFQHSTRGHFNGLIDEVKIFSAALTADEVKQDFNKQSAISMGSLSDTSGLTGGSVASNSATAQYCVPGSTDPCSPPIAEWKMEEGTGTTLNDTSGNAHTSSSWSGTPTWTTGKIGKSLNFNGSSYVVIPDATDLNMTGSISISAWVKTTQATYGGIVAKYAAPGSSFGYDLGVFNNKAAFNIRSGTNGFSGTAYSANNINDGQWHFIETVFNGSTITTYSDGVPGTAIAWTFGSSPTGNALNIGARNTGNPFTGQIDNVRIYNYARTAPQIAWEFNNGKPFGFWKLDDCTGTVAKDSSGNSKNGTITIGATGTNTSAGTCTGSAGEAWKGGAVGRFNSGLDFDGTDDYITIPGLISYSLKDFTTSAWIRATTGGGRLFSQQTGASYWMMYFNTFKLSYQGSDDGAVLTSKGPTLNDGSWHHVAIVRDTTTTTITYYVDGKNVGTITSGTGTYTIPANLYIASHNGSTQLYTGSMDDMRIYNYALTATQIKNVYNEGSSVRFGP